MSVAHDSISYPTLGALLAHYKDQPIPSKISQAAYGLTSMYVTNLAAGRYIRDGNHVEYKLYRSFEIIPDAVVVRLLDNAQRAYDWCVQDAAEQRRIDKRRKATAASTHPDDRVGNQAGYTP